MGIVAAVTILLVDDDPMIRSLGKELLEHLGYRVLTAGDGDEALTGYQAQGLVDLVVLDFHLPGQSGLRVLQSLKAVDPGARILMASGYFSPQEASRIQEGGASGLIHKPFRVGELQARIRLALAGMSGW